MDFLILVQGVHEHDVVLHLRFLRGPAPGRPPWRGPGMAEIASGLRTLHFCSQTLDFLTRFLAQGLMFLKRVVHTAAAVHTAPGSLCVCGDVNITSPPSSPSPLALTY